MRRSYLEKRGVNLFQGVKEKCREAEAAGQKLYRLSIGQPAGPALLSARKVAAEAVMSDQESMHEYQDNGSPGIPDFARRFVQAHFPESLEGKDIDYLPIPGIKPMLGMVQLACGATNDKYLIGTTDKPGYPTPADWAGYLDLQKYSLPLNPENEFRFTPDDIREGTKLLMVNYPHNPSGQIGTREWWHAICAHCEKNDIRLFNDAPYYILAHSEECCALTEVAPEYSNLSWVEAYSASKVISNGTGWRVGALAGSPDFISDVAVIKGNTDSGFAAPMAVGALNTIENDKAGVYECRDVYSKRIDILLDIMTRNGMRLAIEPKAGFFTLWKCPDTAFGEKINDAEQFNYLMIRETGIVGVHFDPYIRYSVTGDIEAMADVLEEGFKRAEIGYSD